MGLSSNLEDDSFPGYKIKKYTKQRLTDRRLQRDIYTMFVVDDIERKAKAVQLVRLMAAHFLNNTTFNHVTVNEIGTGVTMKDVTDIATSNSDHSQDGGAINAADKVSISVRKVKNWMENTQSPMAVTLKDGELELYSKAGFLRLTSYKTDLRHFTIPGPSGEGPGVVKRCGVRGSATKNGKCRL
eukprot:GHVS01076310.1.p1 GENE.GHVS01076310.1~~GHVS01076310.1.p1  ORF type:complete len:185 (-),score=16.13 GHVS01076310.1:331-885(-)